MSEAQQAIENAARLGFQAAQKGEDIDDLIQEVIAEEGEQA